MAANYHLPSPAVAPAILALQNGLCCHDDVVENRPTTPTGWVDQIKAAASRK